MSHSFGTAIPHGILTGISFWSLKKLPESSYFGLTCYFLYLFSGILGIITYGSPNYGIKIRKLYSKVWNITITFGIPIYLVQFYVTSGVDIQYAFLHLILPFTHYFKLISDKSMLQSNIICIISLGLLSLVTFNNYGISTMISFLIAEYGVYRFNGEVPPKDLFTYALSFAQFFSIKGLIEASLSRTNGNRSFMNLV